MIEVNNLSFSYDYNNKKILKNISFKLFENEKLCIIGPNGSGKTTLLKSLSNILDFQGSIFINNKNIKESVSPPPCGRGNPLSLPIVS